MNLRRREFLKGLSAPAIAAVAGAGVNDRPIQAAEGAKQEWRNKQPEMAYRSLGRTGLMVSEVISGGDPIRLKSYKQLELAIDMGLNCLDMASAYGGGQCEEAYGRLVGRPSMRDRVFMNTKISGFTSLRNRLYQKIFDGLPDGKRQKILERARILQEERAVLKPGYYFTYFPNQARQFAGAYRTVAMQRDYAHRVEGSKQFREYIVSTLEGSLRRARTDYFDTVMCPHGACAPEEVQVPEVFETFDLLRRQGKVRFLGVSSHNDPAGVLRAAAETGKYDLVMPAYNICNGGYLEEPIRTAAAKGVGVIAMKAAMAVATQHERLRPIPDWRIQKVDRIVPGDLKPPLKAYLWVLQNPHVTAVNSNLWDETYVRENLSVAGKKVDLQPG